MKKKSFIFWKKILQIFHWSYYDEFRPQQDNNDNFVVESNRQKMAKAPDGEDEHPFVVGRFPISDCDGKLEAFNLELSRRPDEWSACVCIYIWYVVLNCSLVFQINQLLNVQYKNDS